MHTYIHIHTFTTSHMYIILLNNEHINAYITTKGRGQSLMMQVVFSHCWLSSNTTFICTRGHGAGSATVCELLLFVGGLSSILKYVRFSNEIGSLLYLSWCMNTSIFSLYWSSIVSIWDCLKSGSVWTFIGLLWMVLMDRFWSLYALFIECPLPQMINP